MLRLSDWFSPSLLDLIWFQLFGCFFLRTKEETRAWFARKNAADKIEDFNEIFFHDGDQFK